MLLVFKTMTKDEMYRLVQSVYKEASYELAKEKHPDMEDLTEAIREEENYYVEKFLSKFLLKEEHAYCVLEENGEWVSALRLAKCDGYHFMEAMETAPAHRHKGYASKLMTEVLKYLAENHTGILRSNVRKTNVASLATHRKCGFVIEKEVGYNPIWDIYREEFYTMLHRKGE